MIKKKLITRKEFLKKTGMGIAGITVFPKISVSENRNPIELIELGKTGIKVSPLCFGASRTRDEGMIRFALDRGINFIDTGRSYARGNNERLVGEVIADNRKKIVVQSKIKLESSELRYKGKGKKGSNEINDILSRRVQESLEALKTDYIDIMLYHSADTESLTFHDAVLKFYDSIKSQGIIRAHGFSSHDYELKLVQRNNKDLFYDIIMHPFNFKGAFTHSLSGWSASWDQDLLIKLLREAHSKGTGIVAMKSCSAGPLENKTGTPSYKDAVQWVITKDYIDSAAVAMVSYDQIDEHTS